MKTEADIADIIEQQHYTRLKALCPSYVHFLCNNGLNNHEIVGGGTLEMVVPYNFLGLPIAIHPENMPCNECQYPSQKCEVKERCMAIQYFESLKTNPLKTDS